MLDNKVLDFFLIKYYVFWVDMSCLIFVLWMIFLYGYFILYVMYSYGYD